MLRLSIRTKCRQPRVCLWRNKRSYIWKQKHHDKHKFMSGRTQHCRSLGMNSTSMLSNFFSAFQCKAIYGAPPLVQNCVLGPDVLTTVLGTTGEPRWLSLCSLFILSQEPHAEPWLLQSIRCAVGSTKWSFRVVNLGFVFFQSGRDKLLYEGPIFRRGRWIGSGSFFF